MLRMLFQILLIEVVIHRLDFEDVPVNSLARESRLVLILSGRTQVAQDGNDKDAPPQFKQEDIGWAAVQFLNYEG